MSAPGGDLDNPLVLCDSDEDDSEAPSAPKPTPVADLGGQCERSAFCTRGFRHAGKGGRCNCQKCSQSMQSKENVEMNDDEACDTCAGKSSVQGNEIIFCDACDTGFHQLCLIPPLANVPADEWFCASCAPMHAPATDA
eukprot:1239099-Prymnesium_polylepis.1